MSSRSFSRFAHSSPLLLSILFAACAAELRVDPIRAVRISVRSSDESTQGLSSLSYKGGFETKTLVYETLVRMDAEGRIAPMLAQSWRFENGGRECVMEIRRGARFHDGTPVTAAAVREHFRRWAGLPEHDWLPVNRHIVDVRTEGESTFRIVMDQPHALLPELCAINPCAIRAPSTLDFEGNFVRPVGSGPFTFDSMQDGGRVLRYTLRQRPGRDGSALSYVDLVRFVGEGPDVPVDELLAGRLDVVTDSWRERIPRRRLAALRQDRRVRVLECGGSSVISLGFKVESGPCADAALRKAIQKAVDRAALIDRVELGHADPTHTFLSPSVKAARAGVTADSPPATFARPRSPLRLIAREESDWQPQLAEALAEEIRGLRVPVDVVLLRGEAMAQALDAGDFDLRLESSWGVPYDPYLSLSHRFGPPLTHPASDNPPLFGRDARLEELVAQAQQEWDEERRNGIYEKIQDRIHLTAIVIPLYVPRRFALVRAGLPTPVLDHDLYRVDAVSLAPTSIVRQP